MFTEKIEHKEFLMALEYIKKHADDYTPVNITMCGNRYVEISFYNKFQEKIIITLFNEDTKQFAKVTSECRLTNK